MQRSPSTFNGNRFFFDVSGLLTYVASNESFSGIQRVVAEVINEFGALCDHSMMFVTWYDDTIGGLKAVALKDISLEAFDTPASLRRTFDVRRRASVRLAPFFKSPRDVAKERYHRMRLDLMAFLGRESTFEKRGLSVAKWREMRQQVHDQTFNRTWSPSEFSELAQKGDQLVLLDCSWEPRFFRAFADAKKRGVIVNTLVHDLIPIITPELTGGNLPRQFLEWIESTPSFTSRYLANSKATAHDLSDFLCVKGFDYPVSELPLAQATVSRIVGGSELSEDGVRMAAAYPFFVDASAQDERLRRILRGPYVLCVGTIEGRKNLWRLAMAWKYLVDSGHVDLPQLVIAGRMGVHQEEFNQLIDGTDHVYGYLRVVEQPSDEELALLYKHCLFTAMPSLYEGWGLPVGEALAYGKTALVSRAGALPEVGGEFVEYCDPSSVKSIANAVLQLIDEDHRLVLERRIEGAKLRNWADVAQDLAILLQTPS